MKSPVFIVGCPRSGTTLLYSMLAAAGGFAMYRKETYFFDLIARFPDLRRSDIRRRFADQFLAGYLGKVPGFAVAPFVEKALDQCTTSREFLPLLMNGITRAQHMDRWMEATPVHVLHMTEIKRTVPDAVFVHVIRDGRDCAVSSSRQHWIPTLPWDRERRVGVAALFWEWMVRSGRAYGIAHPADCFEVRFEDLIADPSATLQQLGRFIDHDLDYDRIRRNPVHALACPNTSFRDERGRSDFNPVGRWKNKCSPGDLELCEMLIGRYLGELGYPLATPRGRSDRQLRARLMRASYLRYFATRHRLKARSALGRFMTNTRVWAEQPKADEKPVRPVPAPAMTLPERRHDDIVRQPAVLWFTGLSGAGKSTIAREVCERVRAAGGQVEYLDGDLIRSLLPQTGFSKTERDAHVRRVGFLASRLEHHGVLVVCALISPHAAAREFVRGLCRRFVEIHVSTPLEECERRDVKGLYMRARRGEIRQFTGVDDLYEPPVDPELRIDTTNLSLEDSVDLVLRALETAVSRSTMVTSSAAGCPDHASTAASNESAARSVGSAAPETSAVLTRSSSKKSSAAFAASTSPSV